MSKYFSSGLLNLLYTEAGLTGSVIDDLFLWGWSDICPNSIIGTKLHASPNVSSPLWKPFAMHHWLNAGLRRRIAHCVISLGGLAHVMRNMNADWLEEVWLLLNADDQTGSGRCDLLNHIQPLNLLYREVQQRVLCYGAGEDVLAHIHSNKLLWGVFVRFHRS